MTNDEILDSCLQALRTVAAGADPQALTLPTPCTAWNVAQVLQHAAGDQLAWASFVGGSALPDFDPFQPTGALDGGLLERALAAAEAAWRGVDADAQAVPTPLPQGAMSAPLAARACALDAGVHAWDVAVASGQPSPLTDAISRELMVAAQAIVEPLRGYGVYAPVLPPQDGDDETAALLRYLGRDPGWKA